MGGFYLIALLWLCAVLGFAYIILTIANKESGWLKPAGQIIAVLIAVLAVVVVLSGWYYGHRMRAMMKACPMMGSGQMMMKMKGAEGGMGGMTNMMKGKMQECPMKK